LVVVIVVVVIVIFSSLFLSILEGLKFVGQGRKQPPPHFPSSLFSPAKQEKILISPLFSILPKITPIKHTKIRSNFRQKSPSLIQNNYQSPPPLLLLFGVWITNYQSPLYFILLFGDLTVTTLDNN
jgi:hypothetical protein